MGGKWKSWRRAGAGSPSASAPGISLPVIHYSRTRWRLGAKTLAALTMASMVLSGCDPKNRPSTTSEAGADPVPVVETVVHGYETADGTVVRYYDVETGKDSVKDSEQKDDYSDKATAR